jgi:hypothetical protein
MAGALPFQIGVGHGAKVFVDKRHQGLEGFLVASPPFGQEFADDLGRVLIHAVRHRVLIARKDSPATGASQFVGPCMVARNFPGPFDREFAQSLIESISGR